MLRIEKGIFEVLRKRLNHSAANVGNRVLRNHLGDCSSVQLKPVLRFWQTVQLKLWDNELMRQYKNSRERLRQTASLLPITLNDW